MKPDPELDAALEQRGIDSVRSLLSTASGISEAAEVRIRPSNNPFRAYVEDWLKRKAADADRVLSEREGRMLWWTKLSGWSALTSAVLAAIAAMLAYVAWRYPVN